MGESALVEVCDCWTLKADQHSLPTSHFSISAIADFANKEYKLTENQVIVGRDPGSCQVVLPGSHVSRRHAELLLLEEGLFVKDLASSNGTYVNGRRVEEAFVASGDSIRFDNITLTVIAPEQNPDATVLLPRKSSAPVEETVIREADRAPQTPPLGRTDGQNPDYQSWSEYFKKDRVLLTTAAVCFLTGVLLALLL